MENSLKAIIIGAGVVITMVVVSIGFILMRSGQSTAIATINKLDRINVELAESEYTMYDGMEVSGSEVVNAVRKFKDERIGIQVKTNKNRSGKWYINYVDITNKKIENSGSTGNISDLIDVADDEYVNPNGVFLGSIVRDENGTIIALIFEQK